MKYSFLFSIVSVVQCLYSQTVDSIAIKHVDSLIKVSRAFIGKNEFEKALEVNAIAENAALEKLGSVSASYFFCRHNQGMILFYQGNYTEAEKCYLQSRSICENVFGKEHRFYATSLTALANLWLETGNYEEAELLYIQVITLRKKTLGKEHRDYAWSLNNLGLLYIEMGYYDKAESLLLECKSIREKLLGTEHEDNASSLINLAILYTKIGNNEKAEQLYLEHLAIWGKLHGKDNVEYANCLNNLGHLYYLMGYYKKSEDLHIEALNLIEKLLGKEYEIYASVLNNLAILYFELSNFEKAETFHLEANAIFAKVLGKEHPDFALHLDNLAVFYTAMGNFRKAEDLYLESKNIREKVLSKTHPQSTQGLRNLALFNEKVKRFSTSETLLAEGAILEKMRISTAVSFLSDRELTNYTTDFNTHGENIANYALARPVNLIGILPELAFDHSLFYKGFLLTAAAKLNSSTATSPILEEIKRKLKNYRRQLATEYTKKITERRDIVELEEKANTAEKQLARMVTNYSEIIRQVKWQDVQAALKKDEAAVEFIHFKINFPQKTDSTMYAAVLIVSGTEKPLFIPLFEEKSLDSLFNSKSERKADYVNNLYTLADRGAISISAPVKSLYEILWKPLEKELTNVNTIYFSPSGLLYRINLDAIPVNETETLADRYQLIELTSTRQLVIPNQAKIANNEAILFGGIQFEHDSMRNSDEPMFASRSRGVLSFNSIDSTLRGGNWNYLPSTEREVKSIEKIMQTTSVKTKLEMGYDATEESFKSIGANIIPSPRILHIATHGYFFADPKSSNTTLSNTESIFKISEHPMLRSGLILAGGNAAWQGKQTLEGREDGIITAYEISQMNLSNTELVVLSACETGLGDIQGNEGVYGLQRAFKIAGVKHIIMSLWQVPDKQTSLLMTTFYKKWLENKMTIPNAFHAAQKQLRDNGLDPYNWAGFVLIE